MIFLIDNWYIFVGVACLGGGIGCALYHFIFEARSEQIAQVKEWLKYAVVMAEKELGTGTGQLKLRYVYDLFLSKFAWLAKVITFDQFEGYVSEALEWMKRQLETNKNIQEIVNENK